MLKFLSIPVFQENENRWKAELFHKILIAIAIIVSVSEILEFVALPGNYLRWITLLLIIDIPIIFLLYLNRIGYTKLASEIFIYLNLVIILGFAWSADGIKAPIIIEFPFLVVLTAILLGWKKGVIIGILASLGSMGLVISKKMGILPIPAVEHTDITIWGNVVLNIIFVAVLQYFSMESLNASFKKAKQELLLRYITGMKLKESEDKYFSFVNQTHEGIYCVELSEPVDVNLPAADQIEAIIDRGYISECNNAFVQMYGFNNKEELIGIKIRGYRESLLSTFMTSEFVSFIERKYDKIESESYFINQDGKKSFFRNQGTGIVVDGKLLRIWGTTTDITDKKQSDFELEQYRNNLEDIVEQRTKELAAVNSELLMQINRKQETEKLLKNSLEREKELNKLKSRFITTASHEFKTPLTTVLTSIEIIQQFGQNLSDEKKDVHMERVKNSAIHLSGLIDDILYVSRADSGKLVFSPVDSNLYEICSNALEEARLNGDNIHLFELNYETERKNFRIDSKQILTIIQNLISNAVKYSPEGGLIELKVSADERYIYISVKDEGIGIKEKEIPRLFEPFYRSENVGEIRGTGLGLTIVKNAVDLHKGEIKVESKPGKGTVFSVLLPRN